MRHLSAERLRTIRNELRIESVMETLGLQVKRRGSRLAFRCPSCGTFHTTATPKQNLIRCFLCKRSFNPIDLVIAARRWTFFQAIAYLEDLRRYE